MAKNTQPIVKRCRTLGISPAVMGYTGNSKRESNRHSAPQRRSKKSEYAIQLNEKQKVKFVYGVLEKQFHAYYEKATRMNGNTGDMLIALLERRLDNVVFRLGLAATRREARQLVTHGHFTVNGQRVDIPSYLVKAGETIAVHESSRSSVKFKSIVEGTAFRTSPKWIEKNTNAPLEGKIVELPTRDDVDFEIEPRLIVELYSR